MRLTTLALLACALAAAPALAADPAALLSRGDAQRKAGDYDAALATYEEARAAGGGARAEVEKRIGWTLKALRRFAAAERALAEATRLDPSDREAADDLAALRRSRGLRLSGWLGGDEPGTSKQAVNLEAWYGGLDRLELKAGYGWSDAIFFSSQKGFASAYWFYAADSYALLDFTWRQYDYPVELGGQAPNPDTTSYRQAPRATLEWQHWLGRTLRATVAYQLYAPTFWHDSSTRIVNHKATAEAMVPLGSGLRVGALVGALRDPDPDRTTIAGRRDPTVPQPPPPAPQILASATRVKYWVQPLFGGFVGLEAGPWSLEVKGLTNRDLDQSYGFSVITTAGWQPTERAELTLAWVWDRYGVDSAFDGRDGNLLWASGRYWLLPQLALGGGLKWVNNPSPQSRTDSGWRNGPVLLLNLEYRTGIF